ncbi:MAG: hypothetical protein PHQ03_06585 [Methylococcales bacterium]|nr:hypothetical protein [Methylococcales bacterium]MDD5215188.1 hypothetical protein [Methylococcales bacterium]
MFKNVLASLIDHPILTSVFLSDFLVLLLGPRLPFIASFLLFSVLITLCLYFGQKLALFKI